MSSEVAFLGPEGTYTHQAAYEICGPDAKYLPKSAINEVVECILQTSTNLAVVPFENSTFGPVIETYNAFRNPFLGKIVHIGGEHTLAIQHCLVGLSGTHIQNVTRVLSHEQALGQCAAFIREKFPKATKVPVASTALAAQSLFNDNNRANKTDVAICAEICVKLYPGLEILQKSVQDGKANRTRFVLLHKEGPSLPLSVLVTPPLCSRKALIRLQLDPSPPSYPAALTASLSDVFGVLSAERFMTIKRVDRRPSLMSDIPFNDTIFVEVSSTDALLVEDQKEGAWYGAIRGAFRLVHSIVGVVNLSSRNNTTQDHPKKLWGEAILDVVHRLKNVVGPKGEVAGLGSW